MKFLKDFWQSRTIMFSIARVVTLLIVVILFILILTIIENRISRSSIIQYIAPQPIAITGKVEMPALPKTPPVDPKILPQGADKEYLEAVKTAIAKCGEEIYFLGMSSYGNATLYDHYRFTNGNCASGVLQITYSYDTKTMDAGEIVAAGYALGGPIDLLRWNVSSKKAFEMMDNPSSPTEKELFDYNGTMVWDWHYQSGSGFMIIHLNATDGTITRNLVYPSM